MSKACLPAISGPSTIMRNLHQTTVLVRDVLLRNTINSKENDVTTSPPFLASSIAPSWKSWDPTCLSIKKTRTTSGKHKRHCLKKEVIVNVRSGTAAMISQEHPGSVPDVEIMKRHAEDVNWIIGPTLVLADKGYRGVTKVPNLHVVTDENEAEKRARVIVERFFGRLKNAFVIFARP